MLDEHEILSRPSFVAELRQNAQREGHSLEGAASHARQCLQEMAVRPDERYLGRVAWLARFMYTRSYQPELDINADRLTELKRLAETRPLVFLWSHKSHLDSFVFMRALYDNDFRPQPLSFAGINMAFPVFRTLARRSGAIFLRRSFRDDGIYKLVFRHYIDYLVENRLPLSWSIEGTRSRTGKLNPPRLGLIQWVIESYRRTACEDALLIPVSISFDQIAEIDDFVAMQRGLPKPKESLSWFIGYITGMQIPYGRIYLRFAEPISLSETVSVPEAMLAADSTERNQVQRLAFEVCSRIEHSTPIHVTDLITLVLLGANGRALTTAELGEQAQQILQLICDRGLPMTGDLARGTGEELPIYLGTLVNTGLLECYEDGPQSVYRIAADKHLAAAYYRNTIIHYFLASAVAEVALAAIEDARGGERTERLRQAMLALRDLLKFEFFFRRKAVFLDDGIRYLDSRFGDWRDAGDPAHRSGFDNARPLFGHSILRSFVEAHHVLARTLLRDDLGSPIDEKRLTGSCLRTGGEMLLRRHIESETAVSKPLFENAIRLARYRGLLGAPAEDLATRRRQYAAEVGTQLHAIRVLQQAYDRRPTGSGRGTIHGERPE